jgi:hypothetical protein
VKKNKVLLIASVAVMWTLLPASGQDAPQLPPPDKTRPTGDPWKPDRPKPPSNPSGSSYVFISKESGSKDQPEF